MVGVHTKRNYNKVHWQFVFLAHLNDVRVYCTINVFVLLLCAIQISVAYLDIGRKIDLVKVHLELQQSIRIVILL